MKWARNFQQGATYVKNNNKIGDESHNLFFLSLRAATPAPVEKLLERNGKEAEKEEEKADGETTADKEKEKEKDEGKDVDNKAAEPEEVGSWVPMSLTMYIHQRQKSGKKSNFQS